MSRKRILVVDDESTIKDLLKVVLTEEGYDVETCEGKDAVTAVASFNPSLIILDIMMPFMDGIKVNEALKSSPASKHIPVVLMLASSTLLWNSRVLKERNQVQAVLEKPFSVEKLLGCIQTFIDA